MKGQRIGLHVSAAGGVEKVPERALELGAECFQFFSRSPRGGKTADITDEAAAEFRAKCREYEMESYIHTPYYINFASKNKRIYEGSISVVREELERGSKLGVKYVMTHMGTARDFVPQAKGKRQKAKANDVAATGALELAVDGLKRVFGEGPHAAKAPRGEKKFGTKLLLEISAGAGAVLGDSFEELAYLLKGLGRKDVYVCLDTCHMFASGYDMRDWASLDETMKQFRKHLGISRLKLVHVNDSKNELASRKDRHEHIGKGFIGVKGFKALLAHPDFQKTNFILETKHDEEIDEDIRFLKRFRKVL